MKWKRPYLHKANWNLEWPTNSFIHKKTIMIPYSIVLCLLFIFVRVIYLLIVANRSNKSGCNKKRTGKVKTMIVLGSGGKNFSFLWYFVLAIYFLYYACIRLHKCIHKQIVIVVSIMYCNNYFNFTRIPSHILTKIYLHVLNNTDIQVTQLKCWKLSGS